MKGAPRTLIAATTLSTSYDFSINSGHLDHNASIEYINPMGNSEGRNNFHLLEAVILT